VRVGEGINRGGVRESPPPKPRKNHENKSRQKSGTQLRHRKAASKTIFPSEEFPFVGDVVKPKLPRRPWT